MSDPLPRLRKPSQPSFKLRPLSGRSEFSEFTIYTANSRCDSLETNPPHLLPGEEAQIMTATPVRLLTPRSSQSRSPSPSLDGRGQSMSIVQVKKVSPPSSRKQSRGRSRLRSLSPARRPSPDQHVQTLSAAPFEAINLLPTRIQVLSPTQSPTSQAAQSTTATSITLTNHHRSKSPSRARARYHSPPPPTPSFWERYRVTVLAAIAIGVALCTVIAFIVYFAVTNHAQKVRIQTEAQVWNRSMPLGAVGVQRRDIVRERSCPSVAAKEVAAGVAVSTTDVYSSSSIEVSPTWFPWVSPTATSFAQVTPTGSAVESGTLATIATASKTVAASDLQDAYETSTSAPAPTSTPFSGLVVAGAVGPTPIPSPANATSMTSQYGPTFSVLVQLRITQVNAASQARAKLGRKVLLGGVVAGVVMVGSSMFAWA